MSYAYFIRKNNLQDSKKTYETYIRAEMAWIPEVLMKQQINSTYHLRFC